MGLAAPAGLDIARTLLIVSRISFLVRGNGEIVGDVERALLDLESATVFDEPDAFLYAIRGSHLVSSVTLFLVRRLMAVGALIAPRCARSLRARRSGTVLLFGFTVRFALVRSARHPRFSRRGGPIHFCFFHGFTTVGLLQLIFFHQEYDTALP
jgi:hypothetical protein